MMEIGMSLNSSGFWIGEKMSEAYIKEKTSV
jgi:hypothetical protein